MVDVVWGSDYVTFMWISLILCLVTNMRSLLAHGSRLVFQSSLLTTPAQSSAYTL